MTSNVISLFIGAVVTVIAGLLVKGGAKYFKSRIRFSGPDSKLIREMEERVGSQARLSAMILKLQRPQMDALIALLEATKGQVNGNVDRALNTMRQAPSSFDAYLIDEASPECLEVEKD